MYMIKFICYLRCTTCQTAQKWLDENQIQYELRHIKEQNPTKEELRQWAALSGVPLRKLFNTSGLLYKELGLNDKLPTMTDEQMLDLLASDGMLVKRPLLVSDDFTLIGFKEPEWEERVK